MVITEDQLYAIHSSTYSSESINENIRKRRSYMIGLIKKYFPENKDAKVLELGCGYGPLLIVASEVGYKDLVGVEKNKSYSRLKLNEGKFQYIEADIISFLHQHQKNRYDMVCMMDVIEHFSIDDAAVIMRRIRIMLNDGGKLLMQLPNAMSPFFGSVQYGDITHKQAYTLKSITQLMLACGYENVRGFEATVAPTNFKGWVRCIMWRMVRAIISTIDAFETGSFAKRVLTRNMLIIGN